MKRYHVASLLAVASVTSAAAGWQAGKLFVTPAATTSPLYELRLQASAAVPIPPVRGKYSAMTFGDDPPGVLSVEYVSDRIFCSGFQGNQLCWMVLP